MTRQERIRKNEALRKKYEKAFYRPVKKALEAQISSFTSVLRQQGTDAALTKISSQFMPKGMADVIQQLYVMTAVDSANRTLRSLKTLPKRGEKRATFGYNGEWTSEIIRYFSQHLFDKVVLPIDQTTKDYIERVIKQGIQKGWSIKQMTDLIERQDYLDGRVRRILRTESNRAINYGSQLGAEKFEYQTMKRWVAVHDNRTRHWHLLADGQTVNADGQFIVDGEPMSFPGDPKASGRNTINCRCFAETVAARDADGRLVPKQPQQPLTRVRGRLRRELQGILNDLQS